VIKILFLILNFFSYFISCYNFVGNFFILTFFFISSNLYVLYSLRKKYIFTEIFLSIFLWFGFWFKFVIFNNKIGELKEGTGFFDFSAIAQNKALLILSLAFTLLIFLSYLREHFIFCYKKLLIKNFFKKTKIINFYFKYEFFFLLFFILTFILFSILNINFSIYQKGIANNLDINPLFISIFKWLTIFGFASISSFIIFCYLKRNKNIFIAIAVSFLESFMTSYGFLSRASFVFNQISFLLGLKKYMELFHKTFIKNFMIKYFVIIICLSVISIFFVNKKRNFLFVSENSSGLNSQEFIKNFKEFNLNHHYTVKNFVHQLNKNETIHLAFNRWVGLDAWFAVIGHANLNKSLFFDSLKERFNKEKYSYYQNIFLNKKNENYKVNFHSENYGIIVPGFFAYSFYSGSILFFLTLVTFFYLVGVFIEYLSFKFSFGNIIFSSLISQVYVYRLIHFGYLPYQTYLLIGAILLNILLYYGIVFLFNKYQK
jgi:hypothetical protein